MNNINLSISEKNQLTEILYEEKEDRAKHHKDTRPIDSLIDKALGRVTLHRSNEKVIQLYNGINYTGISLGGAFESEHGRFKVQDIDGNKLKINGRWYHKSEFEPAIVTQYKGRVDKRGLTR